MSSSRATSKQVRTAAEMWSDLASAAWRKGTAATDPAEARRWLERARRILPKDDMVGLSLALFHLRSGDASVAATLFASIAERLDVLEAWTGLVASARRMGDRSRAVSAMQAALSRHAIPESFHALAQTVAVEAQRPGWCAVEPGGWLCADAAADLVLDGTPIAPRWSKGRCRIPRGASLTVTRRGEPLLGSPVDLRAIAACEGFVAAEAGDLVGWAWHPGNPTRDPVVTVAGRSVTAHDTSRDLTFAQPLARPRRFRVAASDLPPGLLDVIGADGRPLLGSPIDPGLERRSAAGVDTGFMPVWADVTGPSPTVTPPRVPADVVVPVYRGVEPTLTCLTAVLATLPVGSRLHVVDDAGPDPALRVALDRLADDPRVNLVRLPRNVGFPGAANAGLRAAAGRDVALLNSDAFVPPGWLDALADAAYSAPDIGSACPLSNEATILSYPDPEGGNPLVAAAPLAALARRANGDATVDIPVAVGFCMFIRRDCLDAVGLLREDLFAQGYGEENDWCLRARHRGWRHVAVPGCFVAHEGGTSFGAARRHLLDRNTALLNRLHPGYAELVAAWIARDPLGPARRKIDALRWREGRKASAVVLITHDNGGGVDRVIATRVAALEREGARPIVIRPKNGLAVVGDGDTPNLRYRIPAEWPALLRLLRSDRVSRVELHHSLGHAPEIVELAERLGVPQDVFVHDYAHFCPRIALVPERSYCGEPPIAGCEACIADHGSNLEEDIGPADLVARSGQLFRAASRVVVPASDVANRLRRHFPGLSPEVTPWEDDFAIATPPPAGPVRHVAVVGGIGIEKGFDVLLGCVRDAAARRLDLQFTVVGYTADDERMLSAGPVFITGQYKEGEAEVLLRAQRADLAFIPSIWPETWCFTLSQAWRAGLRAAVFDLGAPAERVRRTGWGFVLPLGMPPGAINDWLLRHGRRGQAPNHTTAWQTPSPSRVNPAI